MLDWATSVQDAGRELCSNKRKMTKRTAFVSLLTINSLDVEVRCIHRERGSEAWIIAQSKNEIKPNHLTPFKTTFGRQFLSIINLLYNIGKGI